MVNKKFFRLYANCIPVKGAKRAVICDLHRNQIHYVPNSLCDFLGESQKYSYSEICERYLENINFITEYFDFLIDKELGFWTSKPENFPDLTLEWDTPEIINNAIIEADKLDLLDIEKLINQLIGMNCKFLEIRFYNESSLTMILEILNFVKNRKIRGIVVYKKYHISDNLDKIIKILNANLRLNQFILHSADRSESFFAERLVFSQSKIRNKRNCGIIAKNFFSPTITVFSESQLHNTCLNRKISIDVEGYIRNCPSMKENFGNIKDTTLQQALDHPDFKKYWFVNKDQISVCKDCEFRYICTDCRAYIENPEDMYSKPLKCGYTPYTGVWEEWSTNPLKQKAIDHYEIRALIQK